MNNDIQTALRASLEQRIAAAARFAYTFSEDGSQGEPELRLYTRDRVVLVHPFLATEPVADATKARIKHLRWLGQTVHVVAVESAQHAIKRVNEILACVLAGRDDGHLPSTW